MAAATRATGRLGRPGAQRRDSRSPRIRSARLAAAVAVLVAVVPESRSTAGARLKGTREAPGADWSLRL